MAEKPNCYACVHRGTVPGSAHSSCLHPATRAVHDNPGARLAGLLGKRTGLQVIPSQAAADLHIAAAAQGIRNGWFLWPVNFDPVWLERCDGFQARAAATVQP